MSPPLECYVVDKFAPPPLFILRHFYKFFLFYNYVIVLFNSCCSLCLDLFVNFFDIYKNVEKNLRNDVLKTVDDRGEEDGWDSRHPAASCQTRPVPHRPIGHRAPPLIQPVPVKNPQIFARLFAVGSMIRPIQ